MSEPTAGGEEARGLLEVAEHTYVALLHYPVYDKRRRIVATAITNLDIHDIARACRTYGVQGYFLVTPVAAQRDLASRIVGHWRGGFGAVYNERRKEALDRVFVAQDLAEVRHTIEEREGTTPLVVATSARPHGALTGREILRQAKESGRPLLLLFGTGWGLSEELLAQVDAVLRPIAAHSDYNHLSVRAAVAIMLDRLFGDRE